MTDYSKLLIGIKFIAVFLLHVRLLQHISVEARAGPLMLFVSARSESAGPSSERSIVSEYVHITFINFSAHPLGLLKTCLGSKFQFPSGSS